MTVTTINTTPSRVEYTATASQTVFTYPFPIFAESELKVYQKTGGDPELTDVLTLTTDYTIANENENGGGAITLVTGATVGDTVVIVHDMDMQRAAQFTENGAVESTDLEFQFNSLAAKVKQLDTRKADKYLEDTPTIDGPLVVGSATTSTHAVTKGQLDAHAFTVTTTDEPVVASITALKALDVSTYTHAYLTGHTAAGDGGGGHYYLDSGSSTADNNGTVIQPTAGAGRWKLLQTEPITEAHFGVTGDGVTDDSTLLQAFVTACGDRKGAISDGTLDFRITSGLTIPNGASIDFNGSTISIEYTPSASTVSISGGTGLNIRNLEIFVPTTFVVDRPINIGANSDVHNIKITSTDQQNNRDNTQDAALRVTGDDTSVSGVHIENFDNGISVRSYDNVRIDHVYIQSYVRAVYFDDGDYCSLNHVIANTASANAAADPGHQGLLASDMRYSGFHDLQLHDAGEHAIRVGGDTEIRSLSFSNISVARPGQCGFKIAGSVRAQDITITGLNVVDCSFGGASSTNEDGFRCELAEHVTLTGFSCTKQANAGTGSYDGIYLEDCTDVTIVSPTIAYASNHGINITDNGSAVAMERIYITSPQIFSTASGDAVQIDVNTTSSTLSDVRVSDLYANSVNNYVVEIDSTDTIITGPVIVTGYAVTGGAGTLSEVVSITDTQYVTDITVVS